MRGELKNLIPAELARKLNFAGTGDKKTFQNLEIELVVKGNLII